MISSAQVGAASFSRRLSPPDMPLAAGPVFIRTVLGLMNTNDGLMYRVLSSPCLRAYYYSC